MANSRIDIVLKAAENGFSITDDAINALLAPSVDSMSVLDRILSGLVSVENWPPIITVAHVSIAIWSYGMDELIRRNILPRSRDPTQRGHL
ncbi:MAG: hypothetical protein WB581_06370 [Halobacteriota archaeon]